MWPGGKLAADELKRDDTTLGVKRRTKRRILRLKSHPRETDDETINRACEALEQKRQLLDGASA